MASLTAPSVPLTEVTVFAVNHQKKFALAKINDSSTTVFIAFHVASKAGVKLVKGQKIFAATTSGPNGLKALAVAVASVQATIEALPVRSTTANGSISPRHAPRQRSTGASAAGRSQASAAEEPQQQVFALDVECVAVGTTHLHRDRSPATVALVNQNGRVELNLTIRPRGTIASFLTPLTGVRRGDLDAGVPLETAISMLKAKLGPGATLVGQAVAGDIGWMKLVQGVDYCDIVDLSKVYATTRRDGTPQHYSLKHEAAVVLSIQDKGSSHSAEEDALVSMQLYQKSLELERQPGRFKKVKASLSTTKPAPNTVMLAGGNGAPCWNGVCMSGYNARFCSCGEALLSSTF